MLTKNNPLLHKLQSDMVTWCILQKSGSPDEIYTYILIYIYYLTLKSLDMPSRFPELYRFPNDSKTIDMAQRWLKQTPENLQLESEVIFHSQQLNVAPVMWHQIKDIKLMTWKRLSTHSKRSDWQQNMQVFTINDFGTMNILLHSASHILLGGFFLSNLWPYDPCWGAKIWVWKPGDQPFRNRFGNELSCFRWMLRDADFLRGRSF